jgi:hypothetical protein
MTETRPLTDADIRVPELDAAWGTFDDSLHSGRSDFSDLDDARLKLYYRNVPTALLVQHVCGGKKTPKQLRHHILSLRRREERGGKTGTKPAPECLPESDTDLVLGACTSCGNGRDGKAFDTGKCDDIVVLGPKKKNETPAKTEETTPVKKSPPDRTGKGKWRIPFKAGTPEYGPAYQLCRKHRKPYPQALALEKKEQQAAAAGSPAPVEKDAGFTIREKAVQQVPKPPVGILPIKEGDKVRQVKPDGGRPILAGIWTVTARRGEICTVESGSDSHKVLAACLEVVGTAS